MNDETSLIAFKAICNFVNDLADEYGNKHHPLRLYKRLINKTQIAHETAIKKHIMACAKFCVVNRDKIIAQETDFVEEKIKYSEKVYIDMTIIFKIADEETKPVIWQHILTISAFVDPAGKAKEILKRTAKESNSEGKEAEFLQDVISKVEQNVNTESSNPMEAVSSLMSSGIFNELLSGTSSGNLDMGKMLGVVQGMLKNLQEQSGEDEDPQMKQTMDGISTMVNGMSNGAPPDMSQMIGMMSGLMGGMNNQTSQVEDISDIKKM